MPRRRRADADAAASFVPGGEVAADEQTQLRPSLDRFADDTSMLGFRYLHSKYKDWFRLTWACVLCFFVGLTLYQVGDRISYYFIYNPLTTIRSFDAPTEVPFPSLLICNKMQLKASKVAKQSPALLRTMCSLHDAEGAPNTTVYRNLSEYDNIDLREVYARSMQTVDDLFLSCFYDKGRSCLEDIKPVFTPQGRCFTVAPNMTVRRPGPETTLTILLNLETYEIIPGMVTEPGAVISVYDKSVPHSAHFAEGIHLDAGKTFSIPINDIRKLTRHANHCGRREIPPMSEREYTRAACQWAKMNDEVERSCGCIPIHSPRNRRILARQTTTETMGDVKAEEAEEGGLRTASISPPLKHCTFNEELGCVENITSHTREWTVSLDECPDDCQDVTFSSVVFGGQLMPTEVASLVRSDWEDDKEKRLSGFMPVLNIIPNARIPLVRAVQSLAAEAQAFLEQSLESFNVQSEASSSAPCVVKGGVRTLDRALHFLHGTERMWKHITSYVDLVMTPHMKAVSQLLRLNATAVVGASDAEAAMPLPVAPTISAEKPATTDAEQENIPKMIDMALFDLNNIEGGLARPHSTFGIRSIESPARNIIIRRISEAVRATRKCLQKVKETPQSENITDMIDQCQEELSPTFSLLQSARVVAASYDLQVSSSYEQLASRFISQLQKLRWQQTPKVFQWHNHDISVKQFESLYRDGGKDSQDIIELLKMRKIIHVDMIEAVNELVSRVESVLAAREALLAGFDLPSLANSSVEQINETIDCLRQLPPKLLSLRKNSFLRAEWMSRVQRQVSIAQSYSPGSQYDEVNLLLVKVYFAHFKQETIVQEKSYNLFLLLAEIGGTIGLYVGATLLTIAETIVFFFEKRTRNALLKPSAI